MKIINIIINEIKLNLKDRRGMVMMIIFPMVLMTVLGFGLSGAFKGTNTISKITVLYINNGVDKTNEAFETFTESLEDMNIEFIKVQNQGEGLEAIKNSDYSCYIIVNNDNTINLYKNERFPFKANLVESVLNTFVQRYNLIVEVFKVKPQAVNYVMSSSFKEYIKVESIDKKRTPTAIDYYSIAILTLFVLYSAMSSSYSIIGDKVSKTWNRILVGPVKSHELFIGKTIGVFLVTCIQMAAVILFSKYILKAYWGTNLGMILIIVSSEMLMAVSLGMAIAFWTKNSSAPSGILNVLIPFIAFLGGAYVPINNFGNKILYGISRISPLSWTNDSIFNIIYANNFSKVPQTLLINITAIVIFMIMAAIGLKKEVI